MPLRAAPPTSLHTQAWFDMDSDGRPGPSAHPGDYSQLNEEQLRTAMRFAEKRLRWVQEEHAELKRAYQGEITAMRKHLIDRMLTRMITDAAPLFNQQRHDLNTAFERIAMKPDEVARLIRTATKGRAEQIGALTEIEAMAVLLRLEREA
jgi:hypothetical protein